MKSLTVHMISVRASPFSLRSTSKHISFLLYNFTWSPEECEMKPRDLQLKAEQLQKIALASSANPGQFLNTVGRKLAGDYANQRKEGGGR